MVDPMKIVALIGSLLIWMVASVYYILEALVVLLIPRSYRRKDVQGSIALITGGGSGLGRLTCLKLAARGAIIVTWDVSEAGNMETARQVRAAGGQCHAYTVDLCDRHAVYAVAAKVKQEVGKVDILVNNAGVVTGKSILDSPDESIIRTFDVNILCHFWTTKSFLGDMMEQNKGHIVTIASMAGKIVVPNLVDYCSSKHAAVGFHEALQVELKSKGKTGVKTTVVCPMLISTGMFTGACSKYIPIMEPDWVADEIVDATLMDVPTLYLPHYIWILPLKMLLLPAKCMDHLGVTIGVNEFMKDFVGRTKDD